MFLIHLGIHPNTQTGINCSILTNILFVNTLRYFSYQCSHIYNYQLIEKLV